MLDLPRLCGEVRGWGVVFLGGDESGDAVLDALVVLALSGEVFLVWFAGLAGADGFAVTVGEGECAVDIASDGPAAFVDLSVTVAVT